ncbi:DNA replication protein DnaD [Clostridia bacterium]|nr:DNA replication protein DnaD [Clostridia bacterium]
MADIALHIDADQSATYVANTFIDRHMPNANGEFVKIYLYLLRCRNAESAGFDLSSAADRFEHTEKDVLRALRYWEKMKLLHLEYNTEKQLSGIYFLPVKEDIVAESAESNQADGFYHTNQAGALQAPFLSDSSDRKTATLSLLSSKGTTAAELSDFQKKTHVRELLFAAEQYLKRPLTPTDVQQILYWYEELSFSTDLIEYLIEYCVCKNHVSLRYMNKVALGWRDQKITTVEQAKLVSVAFSKLHYAVLRAFGLGNRNLTSDELAFIDKWQKQLGFSSELILEACRRTISATHQPSFEYADSILSSWKKQTVSTLADVTAQDMAYQKTKNANRQKPVAGVNNKFNNFTQRSYDYQKLEQQLLNVE